MTTSNPGCLASLLRLFGLDKKRPKQSGVSIRYTGPAYPDELPYRLRDDFLSPAESSFYHVLKTMIGDKLVICPKVSLAEIFFVANRGDYQTFQNKIDRKRVDFLLCNPKTLKPVFAIELDGSSHARQDRIERDELVSEVFAVAKLPLVRVPVRQACNVQELAALFQSALSGKPTESASSSSPASVPGAPPLCPKCSVPMVLRTAKRGNTPGQQFYGCPNYPRCRVIVQLE